MFLKAVLSLVSFASVFTVVTRERCTQLACVTDTLNRLSNGLDDAWAGCNVSYAQCLYFVDFAFIIYM